MTNEHRAATAVFHQPLLRAALLHWTGVGYSGLPTGGPFSPPGDGQASHLRLSRIGQAFGQAPMWRVHGTTSVRRSAVHPNYPPTATMWVEVRLRTVLPVAGSRKSVSA